MKSGIRKVTFPGRQGQTLDGRLDLPAGAIKAYALFAHCFTCGKDIFAASRIAAALSEHSIAVLRFDFTGLGSSEGEFGNEGFTANVGDLLAAADYLRAEHQAPALLIGHSLGGAAVLAAGGEISEVRAVATVGAPADPSHVTHVLGDRLDVIRAEGEAEVDIAGRRFRITKEFLDATEGQKLEATIAALRKPVLILHAPGDEIVGIEHAGRIFQAAKHPKSFVSLDGADHLLSARRDAAYVADVIAAWAGRYVEGLRGADAPAASGMEGRVVVQETGEGLFTNVLSVNDRHALRADEPQSVGGLDSGPTPYDYLLASLGACKSMTMRLYAQRKGLALDRARVTLEHNKIHARDCAECETDVGKIDDISIEIELEGDLDAAARARLIEIADMCPVHRTLHAEVRVRSREKGA